MARANRIRGGFGSFERARELAEGKYSLADLREFTQRQLRRRLAHRKRHWLSRDDGTEGAARPAATDAIACKVATAVLQEPTDIWARETSIDNACRQMPAVRFMGGCMCKERAGGCTCGAMAMGVSECWPGTKAKARRALKG